MSLYSKSREFTARGAGTRTFLRAVSVSLALLVCLSGLRPVSAQTEMQQGMKMKGGMKMEMATEGIFEGEGKVVAVVPDKGQIVLEHEEIKGFMKAMTMGYAVESMTLMKGLESGDAVKFKIDAAKKTIIAVERME